MMQNSYYQVFFCLLIITISLTAWRKDYDSDKFDEWKEKFGIKFESDLQETFRKHIFFTNLKSIQEHNRNPMRSYDQGITQFTGLTQEEFQFAYLFNFGSLIVPSQNIKQNGMTDQFWQQNDIDWSQDGKVTKVKNQGQCNACYAFAAVGSVESYLAINDKGLNILSEQQVIDCSDKFGNFGCIGGMVSNSLDFVKANGLVTEIQYSYKGKTQKCQPKTSDFKIKSYKMMTNSCPSLANSLILNPIAVVVNAANWNTYKSGILDNCSTNNPNFTLLLVGMSANYWKLKNQWGTSWGENGYIRIKAGNTCGICSSFTFPI